MSYTRSGGGSGAGFVSSQAPGSTAITNNQPIPGDGPGGVGQIHLGCGLYGASTSASPIQVKTSGNWGTAPLLFPNGTAGCTALSGAPVYCDTAGQLRTLPAHTGDWWCNVCLNPAPPTVLYSGLGMPNPGSGALVDLLPPESWTINNVQTCRRIMYQQVSQVKQYLTGMINNNLWEFRLQSSTVPAGPFFDMQTSWHGFFNGSATEVHWATPSMHMDLDYGYLDPGASFTIFRRVGWRAVGFVADSNNYLFAGPLELQYMWWTI